MEIKYFINPDINEVLFEVTRNNVPRKHDYVNYNNITYVVLSVCWAIRPCYDDVVHVHIDLPENLPV